MQLSIVIPVFNGKEFVARALESVVNYRGLSNCNYEIICINDGSTDGTENVLLDYVNNYDNVKYIQQNNKGLGGARNTGINHSKGDYILFLDADDYILPIELVKSLELALRNSLDILEFGAEGVTPKKERVYRVSKAGPSFPSSGQMYYKNIVYMNSACNKLYSRQFLISHNLRFLESAYIEDVEFNIRAFMFANKVMCIPDINAHFVTTNGSITRNSCPVKQRKMIIDMMEVILLIQNFISKPCYSNSIARPRINDQINQLVLSLLFRTMKGSNLVNTQVEVIDRLRSVGLYPVAKTTNFRKNIFRYIVNNTLIYKVLCRLYTFPIYFFLKGLYGT